MREIPNPDWMLDKTVQKNRQSPWRKSQLRARKWLHGLLFHMKMFIQDNHCSNDGSLVVVAVVVFLVIAHATWKVVVNKHQCGVPIG